MITPLLCALLMAQERRDILVTMPKKHYSPQSSEYEAGYLSLYNDRAQFLYKKTLWCNGIVNEENNCFMIKEVATRPRYGRREYKLKYESELNKNLHKGECHDWPRVVCVPLSHVLPSNLLGNTKFTFKDEHYQLAPFSPSFVISESINERIYSAESVLPLLRSMAKRSIPGVIHFSWPYVAGLGRFLDSISELETECNTDILVVHMGRRFCIEMRNRFNSYVTSLDERTSTDIDTFLRNHLGFTEFSIEGESWRQYYPDSSRVSLKETVTLGIIDHTASAGQITFNDLIHKDGAYDTLIHDIRTSIYQMQDSGSRVRYKSLMLFPPFFDSFLLPQDTKLCCENEHGEFRAKPLKDLIGRDTSNQLSSFFMSLCTQMDSVADYLHMLRGISTHRVIGKSTALLWYLHSAIQNASNMDETIIVCNYASSVGHRKALRTRIMALLELLKENPDKVWSTDGSRRIVADFTRTGLNLDAFESRSSIVNLDYESDSTGRDIALRVTLKPLADSAGSNYIQKKIRMILTDFEQVSILVSSLDLSNTTLLLPGPIPVLSFRENSPFATKGFDVLYRPFRKVVMMTYVGENLSGAIEQIDMMDELMNGDLSSDLVRTDLNMSYRRMPRSLVVGIDLDMQESVSSQEDIETKPEQNPIDSCVQNICIKKAEKSEELRFRSLRDVWATISDRDSRVTSSEYGSCSHPLNEITFEVRFRDSAATQQIELNSASYVRVIQGEETSLYLASDLIPGQRIAYLKSEIKESLDNFFIRNYAESQGWTLEDVFEPFTCLRYFYDAMCNVKCDSEYDETTFSDLYWLGTAQKRNLHEIIEFLLSPSDLSADQLLEVWQRYLRVSSFWSWLSDISQDEFVHIKNAFEDQSVSMADKIFLVAVAMGMDYDRSSFKALISHLKSGEKRYYFQKPENLLAIGRLLMHERIISGYEDITEAGKSIRVVLEVEGFALSRVIAGRENPLNDMDLIIKDGIIICEILERVK